jgi:hypothetical protein
MNIGFTGTQQGMTAKQRESLANLLRHYYDTNGAREFHHGDCIGADAEAHEVAVAIGYRIVIHPPTNPYKRAFKSGTVRPAKTYLDRNHDIVDESDVMVATPKSTVEELRSGTWATIRYTRKSGKHLHILAP